MKGQLILLVCLVAAAAATSIRGHRVKRQTDRVDLTRCFDEWERDTTTWINNVGRLTTTVLNVFVSEQAVSNATKEELRRQFDAVFDTSSAQVTDALCLEQLRRSEATLRQAIERRWQQLLEDINRKMQKAKRDAEAALETFSRFLTAFTAQTNNNNGGIFGRK